MDTQKIDSITKCIEKFIDDGDVKNCMECTGKKRACIYRYAKNFREYGTIKSPNRKSKYGLKYFPKSES